MYCDIQTIPKPSKGHPLDVPVTPLSLSELDATVTALEGFLLGDWLSCNVLLFGVGYMAYLPSSSTHCVQTPYPRCYVRCFPV
jgi:hypothetical protein